MTAPTALAQQSPGSLPQLVTSRDSQRATASRLPPQPKARSSTYSASSLHSISQSRPGSHVFPIFHSSLPYTLVRDFAYTPMNPLHYGPTRSDSDLSTPASETQPWTESSSATWDVSKGVWSPSANTESCHGIQHLPAMTFGDGPHYSGHVSSRNSESMETAVGWAKSPAATQARMRDTYERSGDSDYGPEQSHHDRDQQHDRGYFQSSNLFRPNLDAEESDDDISDSELGNISALQDSHDYHFTVASPDEEMHGRAVALFDFEREHENELPLTEGQVILVSYRHGQGWLVAEDPKTGESGLVPEEFVRLLKDIEGGLNGLTNEDTAPGVSVAQA